MDINVQEVQSFSEKLLDNLEKVIVGKRKVLETTVIGLLSEGHILIEDVPGTGKTMLARSLARSLGCEFSRIQFTPDLLPSDITGTSIFNQQTREFEFRPGPIMGQIVLADEINRATPKTQSALLEAMEENQITADGIVHALPKPFIVIGTQNPIEYEGTFPLPEAQLDRFLLRIQLGYPSVLDEMNILSGQQFSHPIDALETVGNQTELVRIQSEIKKVHVSRPVKRYIVDIMRATRENSDIYLGASPRGSLGLYRTGQALAAIQGRDYVLPDDIKQLSDQVLSHRLIIDPAARMNKLSSSQIIEEILHSLPIPSSVSVRDEIS
jgi:MoxR-like ATPase